MALNEIIKNKLLTYYNELYSNGEIHPENKIKTFYDNFKQKFGPEILSGMDGRELLNKMFNLRDKDDCLIYWLEFKNDDDFPAVFGSIAGGSALKYGIYIKKETEEWMTGSPQKQKVISVNVAIEIARKYRDQLLAGCELLKALPNDGTDDDYRKLQKEIYKQMPDICNLSWSHKYLSLLFPNKLDDYHNPDYQRFFLFKLLHNPIEEEGRYINAGRYVQIAKELGLMINSFTTILNRKYGKPHRYWRMGTKGGKSGKSFWDEMKDGNFVSIGWNRLGDLSDLTYNKESKERLRKKLAETSKDNESYSVPQFLGRITAQIFNFKTVIKENDIVIASNGMVCLGIGRVTDDGYYFDDKTDFPHKLPVEWLHIGDFKYPQKEGLRTTVHRLKNHENILEFERRIIEHPTQKEEKAISVRKEFTGKIGEINQILERKKQIILFGPPGTGKTYWANIGARNISARKNLNKNYDSLNDDEKQIIDTEYIFRCTFHPAFGYEEFIEGFYPSEKSGNLIFSKKKGIFKKICEKATDNPQKSYFLIIDEINRGDIPRIFGELITLLEADKRGTSTILPSNEKFSVPPNIFIIGTMNTADKSIALLDTALRRRFGFIEYMPEIKLLKESSISELPLSVWLDALNKKICTNLGLDSRNLQIGHAYFLENGKPINEFKKFKRILKEDIIPLLQEYCYENFNTLESILGKGLIDIDNLRIKHELFESSREDELIQDLAGLSPEITTTNEALESQSEIPIYENDENIE